MKTQYGQVILRDITQSDLLMRRHWEFIDTEWKKWDAPWEYEAMDDEKLREDSECYLMGLRRRIEQTRLMADSRFRTNLEIIEAATNQHVGWINCYEINQDYQWCALPEQSFGTAIGLVLPDVTDRGRGLGRDAMQAYLNYFLTHGYQVAYTQTWSGNVAMIRLAESLGFEEVSRKKGAIQVRGNSYDGLTYKKKLK